jgi:hypothetical protein
VEESNAARLSARLIAQHGADALSIALRAVANSRLVGTADAVRLWEEVVAAIRAFQGKAG